MKSLFVAIMIGLTMLVSAVVVPSTAVAACPDSLLGIPTWYRGLVDGECKVTPPDKDADGTAMVQFITKLALNIVQILLMIVAYIAVFFIIKGGIAYITSAGSPDGITKAKKNITNAVIGLIVAGLSASIVNLIAGAIK